MTGDDRGVWYLPSPSGEGTFVLNAHPAGACAGDGCSLHGPSDHWARDMPMEWEFSPDAGGRMTRVCPHGERHDDPDDLAFRRSRGMVWRLPELRASCDCPCDCEHEPPF